MAEYHDQPRAEPLRRELHTADLRGRDDVAGHADHEQIAEALIEHDLGRDARIGAAQHDRERLLARREIETPRAALRRVARTVIRGEASVPLPQPFECFECR